MNDSVKTMALMCLASCVSVGGFYLLDNSKWGLKVREKLGGITPAAQPDFSSILTAIKSSDEQRDKHFSELKKAVEALKQNEGTPNA